MVQSSLEGVAFATVVRGSSPQEIGKNRFFLDFLWVNGGSAPGQAVPPDRISVPLGDSALFGDTRWSVGDCTVQALC